MFKLGLKLRKAKPHVGRVQGTVPICPGLNSDAEWPLYIGAGIQKQGHQESRINILYKVHYGCASL